MEISASASRHRHWNEHWHQHRHLNINIVFTQYKQPLKLKASSIYFVKYVISNKVATYMLEACDFVRKCFAKTSRRKFPHNLKWVTMQNPFAKTSMLEFVFNEIARINSRLPSLMKKKPSPKTFTFEYIRTFSASTGRSYISSLFSWYWGLRTTGLQLY